jgi:hypothetical protein
MASGRHGRRLSRVLHPGSSPARGPNGANDGNSIRAGYTRAPDHHWPITRVANLGFPAK